MSVELPDLIFGYNTMVKALELYALDLMPPLLLFFFYALFIHRKWGLWDFPGVIRECGGFQKPYLISGNASEVKVT